MVASAEDLRARADAIGWYHSIDLGQGVTARGMSVLTPLSGPQLPDLRGRSVLDIGAWDGYYSFAAERLGARRVVALDHYAWGVDIEARDRYWRECAARGVLPDHEKDTRDFWQPDLPGRRGFDLAHEVLGSSVEPILGDFATSDLADLGTFDVTLYLGVLYHVKDPLAALERVRAVTSQVAVVETAAIYVEGLEDEGLLRFHAGAELQGDFGNWYAPTAEALRRLCLAAGFSKAEVIPSPHPPPAATARGLRQVAARVLVGGHPHLIAPHAGLEYRALVHAFV